VLPSSNIQFKEPRKKKRGGKKKIELSADVLLIQKKYWEYILMLDIWPAKGFPVVAEHQAPVRSL